MHYRPCEAAVVLFKVPCCQANMLDVAMTASWKTQVTFLSDVLVLDFAITVPLNCSCCSPAKVASALRDLAMQISDHVIRLKAIERMKEEGEIYLH